MQLGCNICTSRRARSTPIPLVNRVYAWPETNGKILVSLQVNDYWQDQMSSRETVRGRRPHLLFSKATGPATKLHDVCAIVRDDSANCGCLQGVVKAATEEEGKCKDFAAVRSEVRQ